MSSASPKSALSERLVATAAIALPLLLLFAPMLWSGRTIAYRDAGHFYYPLYQWIAEQWGSGNVPFWNPLDGAGSAVVDETSSGQFYPGKIAFALPLAFPLRYNLFLVGHCVLAAAGAYCVARRWQTSRHAAALAALSYGCSGSVAFQCCNAIYLIGAAWLPFAWLAIDCIGQKPSLRGVLGLATVLAMMILAGEPQMAVHVLLGGGLYVALRALQPGRTVDAVRDGPKARLKASLVRGIALVVAASAAFSLAAVQILPAQAAARSSVRSRFVDPRNLYESAGALGAHGAGDAANLPSSIRGLLCTPPENSHHESAYDFSIGPWRLAEFVWPNCYGRMFPTHRRWLNALPAEGRIWTPSLYMGLLTTVFALSQFRLRGTGGDLRVRWLSWSLLVFGVGSFGWYGIGWVAHEAYAAGGGDTARLTVGQPFGGIYWLLVTVIPGYVQFRYPAKLMVVASLALSLLAAIGWDAWWSQPIGRRRLVLLGLAAISGVGLALSWVVSSWFHTRTWQADPVFGPFDAAGAMTDLRISLATAAGISITALVLLRVENAASKTLRASLLLLVVALDVGIANRWLIASAPAEIWRHESALAALLRQKSRDASQPPRLFRSRIDPHYPADFLTAASNDRIAEVTCWEHDSIFPKHHLSFGVVNINSSSSLEPIDYEALWRIPADLRPQLKPAYTGAGAAGLPHPRVLRLLGAEFLLLPASVTPDFADEATFPAEIAERFASVKLWQMREPSPVAWIAQQATTLTELPADASPTAVAKRTEDVLFHDAHGDTRAAVVETNQRLQLSLPIEPAASATCEVTRQTATEIVIETLAPEGALVVVNVAYHPEWTAVIDGRAQTVLRTNRVQCGIVAPAGHPTIVLRYVPRNVYRGAWLSGVSVIGLIGLLLFDILRRRRRTRTASQA